jgi:hypothetical protein
MENRLMRLGVAVLALGLCLGFLASVAVHAQNSGVLEGTVVNGTAGGPEIGAGVVVSLYVLEGDSEVQTLETTTDGQGRFRFEGLDTDPALEYWPEVVYLDVATSSEEPYQFGEGQVQISATLKVYETTTDDADIRVSSVHIIAESFGQVLRLSEIYFFGNTGDRAYVGTLGEDGRSRTVFVPLPPGAMGVSLEDDESSERFVQEDDGLWDTDPVPPGTEMSLAFFSYHLVVAGDTVPLERQFAYPVDSLNIMVVQPGLTLRSDNLESHGPQLIQGRQYELYTARDLGPDSPLTVEFVPVAGAEAVSGSPSGTEETILGLSDAGNQGTLRQIGFGLALLAVGAALAYSFVSNGRPVRRAPEQDRASDAPARRLLVELADLDDAFDAGQMTEAEYTRRRAQIYESLQAL